MSNKNKVVATKEVAKTEIVEDVVATVTLIPNVPTSVVNVGTREYKVVDGTVVVLAEDADTLLETGEFDKE